MSDFRVEALVGDARGFGRLAFATDIDSESFRTITIALQIILISMFLLELLLHCLFEG